MPGQDENMGLYDPYALVKGQIAKIAQDVQRHLAEFIPPEEDRTTVQTTLSAVVDVLLQATTRLSDASDYQIRKHNDLLAAVEALNVCDLTLFALMN